MKPKALPVRFDENEHKRLKVFCAEHGISMQEFIMRAVEEYKKKWAV
ncbi:hypothetical protein L1N85_10820 [Paenibacillus alkaliterrae]|nr:plasmid partition protein ParG [Paenibacillus alkaliterrae]MCF2938928.1 hypothetical protein [Paenibacillus alkaliterrae]